MPDKKKHPKKQKQKQKQSQQQVVNVVIQQKAAKAKRGKQHKRQPKMSAEDIAAAEYLQPRQMPTIVYQNTQDYRPAPFQSAFSFPNPVQPSLADMIPQTKQQSLEDIGQVGTEGRVEIIDRPTKKEQLAELIPPVDLPAAEPKPAESPYDVFNKQFRERNMYDPMPGFEFGIGPQVPAMGESIMGYEPMTQQAKAFAKAGTKAYYIEKITQLTGVQPPKEWSLKQLKKAYKMEK